MWGGGLAPPRPPSVAPPAGAPSSSNKKAYAQERQTELEALRQRGLAKLLNKHFTTVTKTIAEERAAAEAALKDLEMRKANTSEFVESTNDGLSYYEKLYNELHQKKTECKRKERETLLLYQRYVDKFGNTGVVAVPSAREMKIGKRPTGPPNVPRPSTNQSNNSATGPKKYLPGSMSPKVTKMTGEIEDELEKHVSAGGHKLPSAETMGFEETIQSRRNEAEREMAESTKKALESKGVDAVYSPTRTRNKQAAASQFGIPMSPDVVGASTSSAAKRKMSESSTPTATETMFGDDDDNSAVSGLTSTANSDTEARLMDFLKTETDSIRQMMDNDEDDGISNATSGRYNNASVGSNFSHSVAGTESANAADKAEAMVRQMQKMLSEAEGGSNNHQLLAEDHEAYELDTPNPNETWVALWDDNHQREYYHETRSGLVQWEKPKCDEDDYAPIADYTKPSATRDLVSSGGGDGSNKSSSSPVQRRLSRRDMYRLKQRRLRNRRRILVVLFTFLTLGAAYYVYHRHQTDPAFADHVSRTIVDPAERLMDRVVGMERIKEMNNVIYKTAVSFMPRAVTEEEERRIREDAESNVHAEIARKEIAKLEAQRLNKEGKARQDAKDKSDKVKKEQDRVAADRAAKEASGRKGTARKEAERKAKEAAGRKELERLAKEEADKKSNHRTGIKNKRRAAEEAKRREIEERKRNKLMRPWHCNLPLSYILNSRCRKLSTANPVFDLKSLIDAMMQ